MDSMQLPILAPILTCCVSVKTLLDVQCGDQYKSGSCPSSRFAAMVDKSAWDTDVIRRIMCVLQLKFSKSTAILLKMRCFFPSPTQYNVEIQEKLQVLVFNIVGGMRGRAWKMKLHHRATLCRASVKSTTSANLSQDVCP